MAFSEGGYKTLVEDIYRRFPSVQKVGFAAAYKPGLEHMEAFCAALGHPERTFRAVHVAGTNGKGSVASMLAAALSATGLKTGIYTSPHLVDFRERAKIAAPVRMVPKTYVYDFLTAWKPYFEAQELSFFEITTGLAFKWFADEGVDVAVVEAGLGGRLDSTNVLTPDLSVVTSVGLDHCALLGDTLAKIAAEKAGIFKPGIPALVGESDPETDPVFADVAWMRCPLTAADKVRPSLWNRRQEILRQMDLQGACQEKNLRTVLAAVDILREKDGFRGLADADAVVDALIHAARRTDFRGRWEKVSDLPWVICDIGHNPPALRGNFAHLEKLLADGRCSSLILVFGIMADKDLDGILPLMPADATYIFVAPDTARALPAEKLLSRYKAYCKEVDRPSSRAYSAESVREGVRMAIMLAQNLSEQVNRSASATKPAPPLIYIGGSNFVVAEAIPLF